MIIVDVECTTAGKKEKRFNITRLCEKIKMHLVIIGEKIRKSYGAYNRT
jgi:hypothetical protein